MMFISHRVILPALIFIVIFTVPNLIIVIPFGWIFMQFFQNIIADDIVVGIIFPHVKRYVHIVFIIIEPVIGVSDPFWQFIVNGLAFPFDVFFEIRQFPVEPRQKLSLLDCQIFSVQFLVISITDIIISFNQVHVHILL